MLPPTELSPVPAVGAVHAPLPAESVGDARQQAFQRSLQTLLGKPLQGEVLARLNDGSFMVRVAGAAARMMLPAGVQVGAQVPMTLLALGPRPTFQISGGSAETTLAYPGTGTGHDSPPGPDTAPVSGPGQAATLAATLLSRAAQNAAGQLPSFDPAAPAAVLSDAARTISLALATVRNAGTGPALAIVGTTPLLASSAMQPQQLAQQLRAALGDSGLFYESHVAEWAAGKRSLSELMREPQMQQALRGGDSALENLPGAPHLASAQLLDLQLQTLEQARVQWQGEAWPGQPMQWETRKEGAQDGQARDSEAAPVAWRSGVVFRFPVLGAISASLVLSDGQVQIRMHAASADSVTLLRFHAGALEKSLAGAGSPLSSLSISQREAGIDDE